MKIVTFGEILLRLNPPGYLRFFQGDVLETSFCGAEVNVAVSLANLGADVTFVTKVPENQIGRGAVNCVRSFGVDASGMIMDGERLGTFYLEKGAGQRPSKVIYDRKYSAFSFAENGEFNWDEIFKGADWFHFTGITPALGGNLTEICLLACKKAKENNVKISCDINYRSSLWTRVKAGEEMKKLMPFIDLCFANEEDLENVFGIRADDSDVVAGVISERGYRSVAEKISELFGCELVAISLRESISANDNNWSGLLYSSVDKKFYKSRKYSIHIVDRVGSGDSFAAGLIYGILDGRSHQESLDFAVASSTLKHSIEGDFNRTSIEEIETLLQGDETGRVKR